MENKEEMLRTIEIENYIWVIYLVIIFLSFIANKEEVNYFINNDMQSKSNYRKLIIIIFSIALGIYYYFFVSGYKTYKNLSPYDTESKKFFETINFIANILILISGVIFLFIAIFDEELETEIAF
jgi:hypothetical protein